MVQGLALGGEYGGAATYVAEHVPSRRRGFATSWIQTTGSIGLMLSLAVILLCRHVLGADHSDDTRPRPHQAQQGQAHRNQHPVQQQAAAGQPPTGAGLLFVNGIAKAATAFFFHGRHCREGRRAPQ